MKRGEYYGGPTYYMERGLGEERRWGKLWLIPAVIFGAGIFSTFFVTSSTLTASQVVAGAFKMDTVNIGGFQIEGRYSGGSGSLRSDLYCKRTEAPKRLRLCSASWSP